MREHIYTDNSACRICMNCKFFIAEANDCLVDRYAGSVWEYAPACKNFEPKNNKHE